MDQEVDDIASAFNNVLLRDGQAAATGNIPMGGNRLINVGAGTNVNEYMRAREFIENVPIYMTDNNNTAGTVSVSASFFTSVSVAQAPAGGTKILVKVASDKTNPVLKLSGHSANIHFAAGPRVEVMSSGETYELLYSSADTRWEIPPERQYYKRTAAEISASVTPTDYRYASEPYDLRRYGFVDDGTDQTSALVTFFGTTIGTFRGTFRAPFGMAFKLESVSPSLPDGVVLILDGALASYNSAGFKQKCYGIVSGDVAADETHWMIVSNHHPVLQTNNIGGAGSTIADRHGQSWGQCAGFLSKGDQTQQGYRTMGIVQWAKDASLTKAKWMFRRIAPYVAVEYEEWYEGVAYAAGSYVLSDNKVYSTVAGGTAGPTQPTHSTGSQSDGGITWVFHSNSDTSVLEIYEDGRLHINGGVTTTDLFSAIQSELDTETNARASIGVKSGSVSRTAAFRLVPTNAGGSYIGVPHFKADGDADVLYIRNGADDDTIATIGELNFDFNKFPSAPGYTAAQIASVAHAVNTSSGKKAGAIVRDTTNNWLLMAVGSAAADVWTAVSKAASDVTPS